MKIGLTYDLRADYLALGYGDEATAEFDQPDTIDAIDASLRQLGHQTERIGHAKALVERLAAGARWDLVFNIAEGLHGGARESQVPAILDAYDIAYTFSDPLVCALTLHKAMAKRVVRDLGLPTPDFRLVESPADIDRVDLPYPLFAKPVGEGSSKGIDAASRIRNRVELARACNRLLTRFRQAILVETFLPGRELTAGIVGTGESARVLGTIEIVLLKDAEAEVFSYANKEQERVEYRLATDALAREAERIALTAWRGLGCRDAGRVDLRADAAGQVSFMEVNPLAGLSPEHSILPILCTRLGIAYGELIRMIVESAAVRVRDDERPVAARSHRAGRAAG